MKKAVNGLETRESGYLHLRAGGHISQLSSIRISERLKPCEFFGVSAYCPTCRSVRGGKEETKILKQFRPASHWRFSFPSLFLVCSSSFFCMDLYVIRLSGVPMSSHSKIYRFIVVIKSAAPLAGQGESERDVAGPPPVLGFFSSAAQEGNTYKYTQETHKTLGLTQNNPMTNFGGKKGPFPATFWGSIEASTTTSQPTTATTSLCRL